MRIKYEYLGGGGYNSKIMQDADSVHYSLLVCRGMGLDLNRYKIDKICIIRKTYS